MWGRKPPHYIKMSYFEDIAKSGGGSFFDSIFGRAGNWLGDKIFGIPKPKSGTELGQSHLDFMNTAFPGTNPWERLGVGNVTGPVAIADQQTKNQRDLVDKQTSTQTGIATRQLDMQEKLKEKELENQKDIAEIQAKSNQTIAAYEYPEIYEGLTGKTPTHDTNLKIARAKLSHEVKLMDNRSRLAAAQRLTEVKRKILVEYQSKTELSKSEIESAKAALSKWAAAADLGKTISEAIRNVGSVVGLFNLVDEFTNVLDIDADGQVREKTTVKEKRSKFKLPTRRRR